MAVIELAEPDVGQTQKDTYNSNIGGGLNRLVTVTVPGGIHWAVVGIVLADAATVPDIEATLIPAIEALAEVTSVNGDQVYGVVPATIEATNHEAVVNVTASMTGAINDGNGGTYIETTRKHNTIKPPLGKKWVVLCCRVPAALDNAGVAALRTAIDGITGTTTVKVLLDGSTPARATGDVQVNIAAHLRIEPVA